MSVVVWSPGFYHQGHTDPPNTSYRMQDVCSPLSMGTSPSTISPVCLAFKDLPVQAKVGNGGAAAPTPVPKRKESPEDVSDSLPRKRPAPVTAIGTGGVTNSSLARMLEPVHSMRAARLAHRPPAIRQAETEAALLPPPPEQPLRGTIENGRTPSQLTSNTSHRHDPPPESAPAAPARRDHAAGVANSPSTGTTEGGVAIRARQRALDRAHNEAVLGAGGDDEAFARTLAEHEAKVRSQPCCLPASGYSA